MAVRTFDMCPIDLRSFPAVLAKDAKRDDPRLDALDGRALQGRCNPSNPHRRGGNPDQSRIATHRRGHGVRPADRKDHRPIRTARLLPLSLHPQRLLAGKNPLRRTKGFQRPLRPGNDPAMDASVLPALLLAAVQTFDHAGRPESGHHFALPTR